MKILLRSRETNLFYAGDEWKAEPNEAVPFPSSVNAWKLVLKQFHQQELEVVYFFGDRDENVCCPIEP
ncbi:MAG TPA: hypothetical protein VEH04_04915 [Verrucomicrobiae bacterium]|nr:hypothetical protein [Verrucomicrobiae bacterium]